MRSAVIASIILLYITETIPLLAKSLYIEEQITSTLTDEKTSATRKLYLKEKNALLIDPILSHKLLFNFETLEVYLLDDVKRCYSAMDMDNFKPHSNNKIYSIYNSLIRGDILSSESMNKKMIGRYDCFEVVIYMPRTATLTYLWLTSEIKAPLDLYYSFVQRTNLGFKIKEINSIEQGYKAYAIETIVIMIRPKEPRRYLNIRLEEISCKNIPNSVFSIPDGYKKVPLH